MLTTIRWNVDPVIFEIGDFGLRYYSLFFALAFIVSYIIVKYMFKKENVPVKELDNLMIYVDVGV